MTASTPPKRPISSVPKPSPFAQAIRRNVTIGLFMRFLYQVLVGAAWIYESIVKPVTRPFWRAGLWLFGLYRRLWDKLVYTKSGRLSNVRAGLVLASTIAALVMLPSAIRFTFDALMFALTYEIEEVYLMSSQEIDPSINLHSIKGCEDIPCTEANSIYYRVREDSFNDMWSLIHHGGFFYPDYVAAAAGTFSKCTVTSYGIRFKTAMRRWDIYPDMLEAHCRPIQNDTK
ncbi:MAG: hypothetical protein EOP83_14610 [Verrucomicrobiaceae bacterium]|nr:MAG: hypothetical protein EOP83_14610 [Verrucomicrobiaceae bacterium]